MTSSSVDEAFTTLEEASCAGLREEAEDALYDLIDEGAELGPSHYNLVIASCIPHGDVERAERWLFRMQALQVSPDIHTYNTLLLVAAEAKDTHIAGRFFDELQEMGLSPDLSTFQTMVRAAAAAGDAGKIEVWFEKLMNLGLQPDHACCKAAVKAFADKKDISKVDEWLGITEQSFGFEPDIEMLTIAMRAYADSGDLERAESIMKQMLGKGMQPPAESYAVLTGNGDRYRPETMVREWSQKLKDSGVEVSAQDYEALIGAWATVGDAEEAQEWFSRMIDDDVHTTDALATVVEAILVGSTRLEETGAVEASQAAQAWVSKVRDMGVQLTPAVYGALASADIVAGDFEQVEARLQQMEADGIDMDERGLTAMLLAYANAKPQQSQLAEQVFKQNMLRGKIMATREVLEALRFAVGGARCLALRRELDLTTEHYATPSQLAVPKPGNAPRPHRQWARFNTEKVEELAWAWE